MPVSKAALLKVMKMARKEQRVVDLHLLLVLIKQKYPKVCNSYLIMKMVKSSNLVIIAKVKKPRVLKELKINR